MDDRWTVSHDFLFAFGGAERVTQRICQDVLPQAPLVYLAGRDSVADLLRPSDARKSLLPYWVGERLHRVATPIYPSLLRAEEAVEANLLASSYAFALQWPTKGAKLVYCHSPLRQVWSGRSAYGKHSAGIERWATRLLAAYLRKADLAAVREVSGFISTSRAVSARIARYYGQAPLALVPPPYDSSTFSYQGSEVDSSAYLWVGRIVEPYKRLALTLEAFRAMPDLQLTVVGDGRDRARLQRNAPSNAHFVGWRSAQELRKLYASSAALVFPSEDDFGITPVEAMGCGCPVVAYGAGGALDTVVEGFSGVFFVESNPGALASAVRAAGREQWDRAAIATRARQAYGPDIFAHQMREVVQQVGS